MKSGSRLAKRLWPISCLLAVAAAMLSALGPGFSAAPRVKEVNNNPDKFHLVATNSAYDYNFTYDPLAADQWRFETGGFIVASPQ
jgi:hypothetical protein